MAYVAETLKKELSGELSSVEQRIAELEVEFADSVNRHQPLFAQEAALRVAMEKRRKLLDRQERLFGG